MFTLCDSYGKAKLADIERHVAQEQQVLEYWDQGYQYRDSSAPKVSYTKKVQKALLYFLATLSIPLFES